MDQQVARKGLAGLRDDLDRHWIALVLVAWFAVAAWLVWDGFNTVRFLSLGDTDDNMRLAQVRAWMAGQGWYDLRQYRLDPPAGFDIHWSRLVDLPIAGLILFFRLFTSPAWAERLAAGIAPMLPLAVAMLAVAAIVRRLVHPVAWPLAIVLLVCAPATMGMFAPTRLDHHGWQLAFLALSVAGLCDPRPARGGAILGLAGAASLTIGLELLPYTAMEGAIVALRWVWDRRDTPRLQAYALSLGGATAAGFAGFASYANRGLRCDALTPPWLSAVVAGAALLLLASLIEGRRSAVPTTAGRGRRLTLALVAGGVVAAGFALTFPQCLTRPEQVSPELARTWLNNVREAKPIYEHPFRVAFPMAALPIAGLIGAIFAAWRARTTPRLSGWAAVALFTTFAVLMLLWQARAGPAAALLAVPGATALIWVAFPWLRRQPSIFVRVIAPVAVFLLASGLFAGLVLKSFPIDRPTAHVRKTNRITGDCTRTSRLLVLNRYPPATIFTFNDMGPRLIVVTHHSAVSGPYHRNGDAILDVHHAFQRSPDQARAIIARHHASMVMICPGNAESTIHQSRAPNGFYAQLARGQVPGWLTRLPLPSGAPYRLYRVN